MSNSLSTLSKKQRNRIKRDLVKDSYSSARVRVKYDIPLNVVNLLICELIEEKRSNYIVDIPKNENQLRIEFGTKTEPYYETEEGMLSLPKYEATNRHLITPINPDWKLF